SQSDVPTVLGDLQVAVHLGGQGPGQPDRDGVADLAGDLCLAAAPEEIGGKPLEKSRLVVGDGSIRPGVEVAALLRFVELGTDGDRGSIEVQAPHDVPGTTAVVDPVLGGQLRWQVVAVPAGRDGRITQAGELGGPSADMEPVGTEGDRKSTRLNSSHVSTSYAVF